MASWLAARRGNLAMLQLELSTHQDPKILISTRSVAQQNHTRPKKSLVPVEKIH